MLEMVWNYWEKIGKELRKICNLWKNKEHSRNPLNETEEKSRIVLVKCKGKQTSENRRHSLSLDLAGSKLF